MVCSREWGRVWACFGVLGVETGRFGGGVCVQRKAKGVVFRRKERESNGTLVKCCSRPYPLGPRRSNGVLYAAPPFSSPFANNPLLSASWYDTGRV